MGSQHTSHAYNFNEIIYGDLLPHVAYRPVTSLAPCRHGVDTSSEWQRMATNAATVNISLHALKWRNRCAQLPLTKLLPVAAKHACFPLFTFFCTYKHTHILILMRFRHYAKYFVVGYFKAVSCLLCQIFYSSCNINCSTCIPSLCAHGGVVCTHIMSAHNCERP